MITRADWFDAARAVVEATGVYLNDEFDNLRGSDLPRAADFDGTGLDLIVAVKARAEDCLVPGGGRRDG